MTTQVYQRTWVPVVGWLACDRPEPAPDLDHASAEIRRWKAEVIERVVCTLPPRGPSGILPALRAYELLFDFNRECYLAEIECECGSRAALLVRFDPLWADIEVTVCLAAHCMDTKLRQVRS